MTHLLPRWRRLIGCCCAPSWVECTRRACQVGVQAVCGRSAESRWCVGVLGSPSPCVCGYLQMGGESCSAHVVWGCGGCPQQERSAITLQQHGWRGAPALCSCSPWRGTSPWSTCHLGVLLQKEHVHVSLLTLPRGTTFKVVLFCITWTSATACWAWS